MERLGPTPPTGPAASPTSADDVVIDIAGTPTVTIASGDQSVHSLTCVETLTITGGSLTVAGTAQLYSSLTVGAATLSGGTWTVAGDIAFSNSAATLNNVTLNNSLDLVSGRNRNPDRRYGPQRRSDSGERFKLHRRHRRESHGLQCHEPVRRDRHGKRRRCSEFFSRYHVDKREPIRFFRRQNSISCGDNLQR